MPTCHVYRGYGSAAEHVATVDLPGVPRRKEVVDLGDGSDARFVGDVVWQRDGTIRITLDTHMRC